MTRGWQIKRQSEADAKKGLTNYYQTLAKTLEVSVMLRVLLLTNFPRNYYTYAQAC